RAEVGDHRQPAAQPSRPVRHREGHPGRQQRTTREPVKHLIVGLALAGSIVATVAAQNTDPQGPRRTDDGVTPLLTAIDRGDLQAVDRLIASGTNVRAANREGVTPLAMACLNGDLPIIDRLLKAGADPKQRGPNGETLLMFAARNGRVEVITRLLAAGAEVNAREGLRGTTALMWAAEQRHPEAVKVLLAAGADPAIASGPAGLPRNYMAPRVDVSAVQEARRRRARATAAGRTYDEQVAFERSNPIAASPGGRADPSPADDDAPVQAGLVGTGGGGLTALVFAAREGDVESAKALLDRGARINQTTEYGWTPLLTAVNNRNYALADRKSTRL